MKEELILTDEPIDEAGLIAARRAGSGMGAIVSFAGIVRGSEEDHPIDALDYESFRPMAEHQFRLLFAQIAARWPVESVRLVHRLGRVPVGESSLWVEVVAPHRGEAFAACQFLIDEMKRVVPIWKKALKGS